jgi:hypothetical protein
MALTQKRQDELYNQLSQRQGQRVREMLTPKTIATKIYPHLPSANEPKPRGEEPKQPPIQGWSHLRKK